MDSKPGVRQMIEDLCDGDLNLPGRKCWTIRTLQMFGKWAFDPEPEMEFARH